MFVSPKILLDDSAAKNYAVGAFNFYNLDTLTAILRTAEEEKSPVIVQIYSTHFLHYNDGKLISTAALEAIQDVSIPAALHLDHSTTYECILKAVRYGFNSVMFDGSAFPLQTNIAVTAKVTELAKPLGIFTEAELGKINRAGTSNETDDSDYTKIEDAVTLIKNTSVDSLAPAIGTAHGIYTRTPVIQFERLEQIVKAVKIPIVLHGGTGIPDDMISKCIDLGVRKINVGTELKYMWGKTMLANLKNGEKEPIHLSAEAIKAVQEVVRRKIRLFRSDNKAQDILYRISNS
jgi:ketose-bisphosphate aldolase